MLLHYFGHNRDAWLWFSLGPFYCCVYVSLKLYVKQTFLHQFFLHINDQRSKGFSQLLHHMHFDMHLLIHRTIMNLSKCTCTLLTPVALLLNIFLVLSFSDI